MALTNLPMKLIVYRLEKAALLLYNYVLYNSDSYNSIQLQQT